MKTDNPLRVLILNALGNNLGNQAIHEGFVSSFLPTARQLGLHVRADHGFIYTYEVRADNLDGINASGT